MVNLRLEVLFHSNRRNIVASPEPLCGKVVSIVLFHKPDMEHQNRMSVSISPKRFVFDAVKQSSQILLQEIIFTK